MIITCPSCSARYKVGDEMISTKGKRIKCKKCEAVFVAYPDRDAVLESKAPAAPPQPAVAPPQPAAAAAPTSAAQATVKVDRSNLDKFLQQAGNLDGTQSTLKVDPEQFKQFMHSQPATTNAPAAAPAAGATVQVDRRQIDAFLTETARSGGPSAKPAEPSPSDTVALDPRALSMAMNKPPSASDTVALDPRALSMAMNKPPSASDTVALDPRALSMAMNKPPSASDTVALDPKALSALAMGQTPIVDSSGPIKNPFDSSDEPPFPSDEELGLGEPSMEMASPVQRPVFPPDPAPVVPPAPTAVSQPADVNQPAAVNQPAPPPPQSAPVQPPPQAPHVAFDEKLFQAEVEGKVYPNLTLDAIARWVAEGRLLEQDQIAPNGTENYRAAESYSEFQPFFEQLNGKKDSEEPPKKKGFFAWLFSFGKK